MAAWMLWTNRVATLLMAVVACLILLAATTGCSMQYWGGENAGRTPGVHVLPPTWASQGEISVTSDCNAKIGELTYSGQAGDKPATLTMKNAEFGQTPSTVLPQIVPVLERLPEIQRTQAEYAKVWADVANNAIDAAAACINVLSLARVRSASSGMTITLPGGFSIGGQRITNPGDLTSYLQALSNQLQALKNNAPATTQPAG